MEFLNQKSLERVVSQKALQMGSSFQCKICVVGFLCGVCIASLFVAALTSLGTFGLGGISFSAISTFHTTSSSEIISTLCNSETSLAEKIIDSTTQEKINGEEAESLVYSAWTSLLAESPSEANENLRKLGLNISSVPNAPHLENCKLRTQRNELHDKRSGNASFPPWTGWKGDLERFPAAVANDRFAYFKDQAASRGAYPPWVIGSDEENYPLTREVQRDLWLHQHPSDCKDPSVRFLIADWEKEPGFGIGAQIAGMAGLLAIAINEKRVLVTGYYNRADHDGCNGPSRSSWSCYFFPETSQECRDRAFELVGNEKAWKEGIITGKQSYSSKEIWSGPTPRTWGHPWSFLQPTTEVNGRLIASHRKMDRRWWRAQAVRYLMKFQTEYTCGLMNAARQAAFGKEAARMVVKSFPREWPQATQSSNMEDFVWSSHKPWIPRPLLSMHVRMGDKACEMKVVGFKEYMSIAERIRLRFPHLSRVWLSTEMQEVIDKSRGYNGWKFYHTSVRRQVGNMTMADYEASLGRETSTNYPLVNFLMAAEADFFVGALGSTWCFLIDGMRNTGGKVMAGYLSVNKDRFW